MTPAESAVLEDRLRECRSDGEALSEEVVARMMRAVDGRIESALVDFMTSHDDGFDLGGYEEVEAELREVACWVAYPALGIHSKHCVQRRAHGDGGCECGLSALNDRSGASVSRPQEEPRNIVRDQPFRHACTEPAQDCFCMRFPGACAG